MIKIKKLFFAGAFVVAITLLIGFCCAMFSFADIADKTTLEQEQAVVNESITDQENAQDNASSITINFDFGDVSYDYLCKSINTKEIVDFNPTEGMTFSASEVRILINKTELGKLSVKFGDDRNGYQAEFLPQLGKSLTGWKANGIKIEGTKNVTQSTTLSPIFEDIDSFDVIGTVNIGPGSDNASEQISFKYTSNDGSYEKEFTVSSAEGYTFKIEGLKPNEGLGYFYGHNDGYVDISLPLCTIDYIKKGNVATPVINVGKKDSNIIINAEDAALHNNFIVDYKFTVLTPPAAKGFKYNGYVVQPSLYTYSKFFDESGKKMFTISVLEDGSLQLHQDIIPTNENEFSASFGRPTDVIIKPVAVDGYQFDHWTLNNKEYKPLDTVEIDPINPQLIGAVAYFPVPTPEPEPEPIAGEVSGTAQTGDSAPVAGILVLGIVAACTFTIARKRFN